MENQWETTARKAWERILEKVKALSDEGMSLQKIADLMGVGHRSVICEWLKGSRKAENATFANLMTYMERLGIDYQDYFPAKFPTIKRPAPNAQPEIVTGEDVRSIPVYAIAGAGPAWMPDENEPLFKVFAPRDFLSASAYAVQIDGHSMEPLIPHQSIVGIRPDVPFQANELYLANIPYEGLVVKRIGVDRKAEEFIFKSENPDKNAYPDFTLSINEAEKIIIGRVVWILINY